MTYTIGSYEHLIHKHIYIYIYVNDIPLYIYMYGGRWFEKMGVELQDKDLSPLYIFPLNLEV